MPKKLEELRQRKLVAGDRRDWDEANRVEEEIEKLDGSDSFWDRLGRTVRHAWFLWATEQPDVDKHPSWLLPWDEIDERDRDVDRRIAKAVFEEYDNAACDALDKIAKMCGSEWEYPGQVVRDVERKLAEKTHASG